ncbi:MAG TPA: hypothetical protein VFA46_21755 [Actinomycetes bacterium]|jgi:hypothetical protein|nr:hypothetical protein [Actinomycetes bacterium]
MIDEYIEWGGRIAYSEIDQMVYSDVLEFINFRIETAETILLLIDRHKIADALGLSRSLLEHYLLLILMCRGRKYFQLQDLSGSTTDGTFKVHLQEAQEQLRQKQAQGKTQCLDVREYPRAKRRLMYIFEGLRGADEPDFIVPVHFFHFQEFYPESARLKHEDYFQYHEPNPEAKKELREYQASETARYWHYLSYEALLHCLKLNELADAAAIARIEAHYTFLGKFLHPTRNAARELHDNNNVYYGGSGVGIPQEYSKTAVLLAALYVCYLTAAFLDEVAGLIEGAPPRYVAQANVEGLRSLTASVLDEFPYFWFLFNDPPLYDRFNHCIHHATADELTEWGHYRNIPAERVAFDQHIYGHLQRALAGRRNDRCGVYRSPIGAPGAS